MLQILPSPATGSVEANFFCCGARFRGPNSVSQFLVFFPYFFAAAGGRPIKNSALKLHLTVYIGNIAKSELANVSRKVGFSQVVARL